MSTARQIYSWRTPLLYVYPPSVLYGPSTELVRQMERFSARSPNPVSPPVPAPLVLGSRL